MCFSKEGIKKDIPLLLQSYFQGKYFDRCGSVHLGADRDVAVPAAVGADGALRQTKGWLSPASVSQMAIGDNRHSDIFHATVRRVAFLWKVVLLFEDGSDHAETLLTDKFIMEYVTIQAFLLRVLIRIKSVEWSK